MRKKSFVNYDTQWTNEYLGPSESFYFEANTPTEEILPKLEAKINHYFPKLKENYQTKTVYFCFNRLYRNLIPQYKHWQVLYRKPGSKTNYHAISEKIGFKPKTKKQSLQRTVLLKPMCWTHELYPLIDKVEMESSVSCDSIARQLNQKVKQPNYAELFKKFKQDLFKLFKSYRKCNQNSLNNVDQTTSVLKTFVDNLETIAGYSQLIRSLTLKNYKVQTPNISDVLQEKKAVNSTKGWRVEFL